MKYTRKHFDLSNSEDYVHSVLRSTDYNVSKTLFSVKKRSLRTSDLCIKLRLCVFWLCIIVKLYHTLFENFANFALNDFSRRIRSRLKMYGTGPFNKLYLIRYIRFFHKDVLVRWTDDLLYLERDFGDYKVWSLKRNLILNIL